MGRNWNPGEIEELSLSLLEVPLSVKRKLKRAFGGAGRIFEATAKDLAEAGIPVDHIEAVIRFDRGRAEKEIERVERNGVKMLFSSDTHYPHNLKSTHAPPPLLYVLGDGSLDDPNLSVVGSRRASAYGRLLAREMAGSLASCGFTIVSGMARGIDTEAHKGALDNGGKSIAVLGCGIDVVYPPENGALKKRISESGAVVTEFPYSTPPRKENFPRRNRIIAGLSWGTCVVEASSRSGSLITAEQAIEQGRDVFAVPGNVTSPLSEGTNLLIQRGAKLVRDVQDITDEVPDYLKIRLHAPSTVAKEVDRETDSEILDKIPVDRALSVEKLARRTERSISEILPVLLKLEMAGLVRREPGTCFVRTKR
jgi:DNA processing protein